MRADEGRGKSHSLLPLMICRQWLMTSLSVSSLPDHFSFFSSFPFTHTETDTQVGLREGRTEYTLLFRSLLVHSNSLARTNFPLGHFVTLITHEYLTRTPFSVLMVLSCQEKASLSLFSPLNLILPLHE